MNPKTDQDYASSLTDNVKRYFTPEIHNRMTEMSDGEMEDLLRDFESSVHWIAFLKYVQRRLSVSQGAINIADPVKDPTTIARHQGIMMGLLDPQNAVITLVERAKRREQEIAAQTPA